MHFITWDFCGYFCRSLASGPWPEVKSRSQICFYGKTSATIDTICPVQGKRRRWWRIWQEFPDSGLCQRVLSGWTKFTYVPVTVSPLWRWTLPWSHGPKVRSQLPDVKQGVVTVSPVSPITCAWFLLQFCVSGTYNLYVTSSESPWVTAPMKRPPVSPAPVTFIPLTWFYFFVIQSSFESTLLVYSFAYLRSYLGVCVSVLFVSPLPTPTMHAFGGGPTSPAPREPGMEWVPQISFFHEVPEDISSLGSKGHPVRPSQGDESASSSVFCQQNSTCLCGQVRYQAPHSPGRSLGRQGPGSRIHSCQSGPE